MDAPRNHANYSNFSPLAPALQELDLVILQMPESEQWRLLQEIIDRGLVLRDETVSKLDAHMQGSLFLQDWVENRRARIEFARSPGHMAYLRDAAGSRNVWMTDAEFNELVEQDDSETLACFARSEEMLPHHLAYIGHKLALQPHGNDVLANAYDASITLKKALERRGRTGEMALFLLARAALEGAAEPGGLLESCLHEVLPAGEREPRALWRAYRNLASLDSRTLRELLQTAELSRVGPLRTSRAAIRALH